MKIWAFWVVLGAALLAACEDGLVVPNQAKITPAEWSAGALVNETAAQRIKDAYAACIAEKKAEDECQTAAADLYADGVPASTMSGQPVILKSNDGSSWLQWWVVYHLLTSDNRIVRPADIDSSTKSSPNLRNRFAGYRAQSSVYRQKSWSLDSSNSNSKKASVSFYSSTSKSSSYNYKPSTRSPLGYRKRK